MSFSVGGVLPIHDIDSLVVDLSFPPIRGVYFYLTLKAVVVHACGNPDSALFDVSDPP